VLKGVDLDELAKDFNLVSGKQLIKI